MADVFLSYKAEDRARVEPLVRAFEDEGFSVWWDAHIGGGDSWRDEIQEQLEAARCVVVVWSKRSVGRGGHFVRDEATRALRRQVYLPVQIDRVDPPLGFGETQALFLVGWNGKRDDRSFQMLAYAVRAIVEGKEYRAAPAVGEIRLERRSVIAGSVAAVAIAGLGGWLALRPKSTGASASIAVLPFANLSGDPAQAYFSDGMAEELRTALSRINGLRVAARTSSEAVRNEDAKAAANRLGVSNILTGSVRRSSTMIRISAQLVDGDNGIERWAASYDRPAGDTLQIQTDIADKVADALSIRLAPADRNRIAEGGTDSPEAHDLLLQAHAHLQQTEGAEAWTQALGMVDAALALDPQFADAWAAKAAMLKVRAGAMVSTVQESRRLYTEAENAARKAIRLAPQSRAGVAILADIYYEQLKPRAALAQFQKMQELPGENADAHRAYAIFLGETGRTGEALAQIDRALAIDPLNGQNHGWKAYILAAARRYPEAIASLREYERLSPGRKTVRMRQGYYLTLIGHYAEAARALGTPDRDSGVEQTYRAVLAVRTGRRAEAERIVEQLRQNDYASYQVAEIFAQLGKKNEALEALENAWNARDSGLTTILYDPLLDPLRGDPRFEAIVKRIDFPT